MLAEITVSGVFSSCPASVMNCFCCTALSTSGRMARELNSPTSSHASNMQPAQAAAEISARLRTWASLVSQFKNRATRSPDSPSTRNR